MKSKNQKGKSGDPSTNDEPGIIGTKAIPFRWRNEGNDYPEGENSGMITMHVPVINPEYFNDKPPGWKYMIRVRYTPDPYLGEKGKGKAGGKFKKPI